MLEEWTYIYKPRPWHFAGPVALIMLGWFVVHKYGGIDGWFVAIALVVIAILMAAWIAFAGGVAALLQYNYEATGENWGETRIHIIKNNRKWALWARQVLAGRPLTQTLWTGTGKLFARGEYEKRMVDMWQRGVLDYANGQTSDQGYAIAGEAGARYIQAMAEGKNNLPNPPLPSPTRRVGQNMAVERTYDDAYPGEGGGLNG